MTFGDYQNEIYFRGLAGIVPSLPMAFADWEAKAQSALPPSVWSYVAGGAGDEHTQRANASAFKRWGVIPRRFVGAAARDLSVELFGMTLSAPVFMAPIGVIGLCAQDGHGGPGHRAGRRPNRCTDGLFDPVCRPDGTRRRRIR